ncbi:DEAD/DEAH box helicase [Hyphococcus sp.]|uniref:DEAD/DEAH box helicase n=1 Tax=Hyphococcus sp. TaxID=2038636 RepID=UPI003D102FA0
MVDFKKRLGAARRVKPTDPITLYETLDRASDKGPLRPAQVSVLGDWNIRKAAESDFIVKLHTGQGKTLIGLLMLQARLNEGSGPAVYLCPDHFLIAQTRAQAKQFGIATCTADGDLPEAFLNGQSILVTSVQKLFNGRTKFGLWSQSIEVGTVLMDDAHACSDRIRQACTISLPRSYQAYGALKSLFASDLEQQGAGTFADIENKKRSALLPVPYWAWSDRESEVAKFLAAEADRDKISFAWPLLKDMLPRCQCIVSGQAIEIEPYSAPLDAFGSYANADMRIFMSATVTDDAFLVKGLKLEPETITRPLTYDDETWSGEKMIVIPSLIHEDLDDHFVQDKFGASSEGRKRGFVALVPSFARAELWESHGAIVAKPETIEVLVSSLRSGDRDNTIVLANRYDGVDLPDSACRVLIFDGRPFSESLVDLQAEQVRPNSQATLMRTLRSVEQGLGRSVRGEKDYSVIILSGTDLVRLVRAPSTKALLSPQVAQQIEIGLEVSELAKEEVASGDKEPEKAFTDLIRQCLRRDEDWKAFYAEQMDAFDPRGSSVELLNIFAQELEAEDAFAAGDAAGAADILQTMLDAGDFNNEDTAWYLQESARYQHGSDRAEALRLQKAAHKKHRRLLKPSSGVTVKKLSLINQTRTERIATWLKGFNDYDELNVTISEVIGRLRFGVKADSFEGALNELAEALGFAGERPDKDWKEGPDNLWALNDQTYLVIEAKSEVKTDRAEINKDEAEQMNRSAAWFDKHYKGMTATHLIIHPAKKIASEAAFTHSVLGITESDLRRLEKACRGFFKSFETQELRSVSPTFIQKQIDAHKVGIAELCTGYARQLKDMKRD